LTKTDRCAGALSPFFGPFPSDCIPKATKDVNVHFFIHSRSSSKLSHWNTQPAVRRLSYLCFAVNSSILSVDGMTSYTIWKLKNRSIEWYMTHRDCIDF
jgi:hypothetical protein